MGQENALEMERYGRMAFKTMSQLAEAQRKQGTSSDGETPRPRSHSEGDFSDIQTSHDDTNDQTGLDKLLCSSRPSSA